VTTKKAKFPRKDPNVYPPGWDYRRTKAIADYYDKQSDTEIVAEIEAAFNDPHMVMVQVARWLLPDILKLINKKKKSA
jgi:hypothetical protein